MLASKTFQGRYVKPGCRRFFSREIFVGFSLAFSRFPRKGQFAPRKVAPPLPNFKINFNPNLNPSQGTIFLRCNCLFALPPSPKINLIFTKTPTLTGRQFCLGGNCPDTFENTPEACYSWQWLKEEDIFLCSCKIMKFLYNEVFYLMTYII